MELYVHIPFCVRKCSYCDFLSFPAGEYEKQNYVDALCRELGSLSGLPDFVGFDTVFIGGGTPSVLPVLQMEKILEKISGLINRKNKTCEFTIECNPGTLDKEKLALYGKYGVNRLSIGLQSADNTQLKALGRIHTFENFLENYELARDAGFKNINIDLMSAIPGQSISSWEKTLEKTVGLKPEHISAYSLIIEPGTPLYRQFEAAPDSLGLPDEDTERDMYHVTKEILAGNGYGRYEISNYAKAGFECRHNLGYWTGEEYVGCGLGASSYLKKSRVEGYPGGSDEALYYRLVNTDSMNRYLNAAGPGEIMQITERLAAEDLMGEFCILALRLVTGIDVPLFEKKFARSFTERYGKTVHRYVAGGFMKYENDHVFLTDEGFDVSNTIMSEFL